jgi:HAMP domain-containing protein
MSAQNPPLSNSPSRRRFSLFLKILLAMLFAGLVPLGLLGANSLNAIQEMGATAKDSAVTELNQKSIEAVQVRAEQAASQIETLLEASVKDTLFVAGLEPDAINYEQFYTSRLGRLWYLRGDPAQPQEVIEQIPLYREMAYVGFDGFELLRIVDGDLLPEEALRDLSDPANTTYLTETYFQEAIALSEGEVYVSPVMAWYTTTPAQPAKPLDYEASRTAYADYEAVIRFATPVYRDGEPQGVVVLSLDHRHVMELVNHIYSLFGNVVYPDYASGNYAYLLDYEGWLIAHADLSYLRGLDPNGNLMPTWTVATQAEELPFNMAKSDIKAEAVVIANNVLSGNSGSLQSLTRKNTDKVDAYVPVHFAHGVYRQAGIFGGVVISENLVNVEKAGEISAAIIGDAQANVQNALLLITGLSAGVLIVAAILVSRNITGPLLKLTHAAKIMQQGELDLQTLDPLLKSRVDDEVTELSRVFKQMAQAVQLRERRLREEVEYLRIQIDETKKQKEVESIVQSEVFRNIQERAAVMRAERHQRFSQAD